MGTLLRRCAECTIVFTLQGGGTPSTNCRSPAARPASARETRVFKRLFARGVVKWFQGLGY
ncbi:MAG: hypothetical protein QW506_03510 [Thermoproteota archaeon]|nr:hypothetical protein [Candidatus Brockarchaeota archaeon]